MHLDDRNPDVTLVRQLLAGQFPHWAALPLTPVSSAGTDHTIFRLGDALSVRLPRVASAAGQVRKEHQWLPRLAPELPLHLPLPLSLGAPAQGYPWNWSVCEWVEGDPWTIGSVADACDAAAALASFVGALRRIDPTGGPPPGEHNFHRGVPLSTRDTETRAAIAALRGLVDVDAITAAWESALAAPPPRGSPTWIHGDLQPANLVVANGRISGVIDFGGLAVGDPACDLMVAWTTLDQDAREVFRDLLAVDNADWARGRGWALSFGVIALPCYRRSNPVLAGIAEKTIRQSLLSP